MTGDRTMLLVVHTGRPAGVRAAKLIIDRLSAADLRSVAKPA